MFKKYSKNTPGSIFRLFFDNFLIPIVPRGGRRPKAAAPSWHNLGQKLSKNSLKMLPGVFLDYFFDIFEIPGLFFEYFFEYVRKVPK